MNLIIPMAGRSSRFPNLRPKWMLTHPNGQFMVLASILQLDLAQFENIFFVYLQEHEEKFRFAKGFIDELDKLGIKPKSSLISLNNQTRDQSETVYQAIRKNSIRGPIFIKDSDNSFSSKISGGSTICYSDLNECGLIKPKNKSYITFDEFSNVNNIIEKKVISPYFCVGGYGFESADLFCDALNNLDTRSERYISNVVFECILAGEQFRASKVDNYLDWGTLQDWENYKRSFATLFLDIDGVLFQHSSSHFPPYYGETETIAENVEIINKLRNSGKFQIVLTTARPEEYRSVTTEQLRRASITYDYLLMGLLHAKRIIINDYSKSNPYKSCDAINLKRNSSDLKEILRESLGIDYEDI